jgi:hypothetical protein
MIRKPLASLYLFQMFIMSYASTEIYFLAYNNIKLMLPFYFLLTMDIIFFVVFIYAILKSKLLVYE